MDTPATCVRDRPTRKPCLCVTAPRPYRTCCCCTSGQKKQTAIATKSHITQAHTYHTHNENSRIIINSFRRFSKTQWSTVFPVQKSPSCTAALQNRVLCWLPHAVFTILSGCKVTYQYHKTHTQRNWLASAAALVFQDLHGTPKFTCSATDSPSPSARRSPSIGTCRRGRSKKRHITQR